MLLWTMEGVAKGCGLHVHVVKSLREHDELPAYKLFNSHSSPLFSKVDELCKWGVNRLEISNDQLIRAGVIGGDGSVVGVENLALVFNLSISSTKKILKYEKLRLHKGTARSIHERFAYQKDITVFKEQFLKRLISIEEPSKELRGVEAIAEHLGLSSNTIRTWMKLSGFPAHRDPPESSSYTNVCSVEELEEWIWSTAKKNSQKPRILTKGKKEMSNPYQLSFFSFEPAQIATRWYSLSNAASARRP